MVEEERIHYVDVNVFVYWLTSDPRFGETALKWIENIESCPSKEYFTSSLCLYETIVIVAGLTGKKLKDKIFTSEVIKALTQIKGLVIEPIKTEDFITALNLMNDFKLDFEDSLHLAVATRIGAKDIISNDKDFNTALLRRSF